MKRIAMILIVLVVSAHYAWSAPQPGPEACGPGPMFAGPIPGPGGPGGPGHLHPLVRMAEDLGLGADQKKAVAQMLKKNRDTFHAAAQAMHTAMENLRKAVDREPLDEGAIKEANKAVAAAGETMSLLMARERADFRALLTAEQRTDMDKKIAQMKDHMEKVRMTTQSWIDKYGN